NKLLASVNFRCRVAQNPGFQWLPQGLSGEMGRVGFFEREGQLLGLSLSFAPFVGTETPTLGATWRSPPNISTPDAEENWCRLHNLLYKGFGPLDFVLGYSPISINGPAGCSKQRPRN
ncbi:MAG: hypothetical protein AAF220_08150, partial [Pseudomonadota bacterium]